MGSIGYVCAWCCSSSSFSSSSLSPSLFSLSLSLSLYLLPLSPSFSLCPYLSSLSLPLSLSVPISLPLSPSLPLPPLSLPLSLSLCPPSIPLSLSPYPSLSPPLFLPLSVPPLSLSLSPLSPVSLSPVCSRAVTSVSGPVVRERGELHDGRVGRGARTQETQQDRARLPLLHRHVRARPLHVHEGQLVSWRPLDICRILCGIVCDILYAILVVRVVGLLRARLMTTQCLCKSFYTTVINEGLRMMLLISGLSLRKKFVFNRFGI